MLSRKRIPVYEPSLSEEVNEARINLAKKGWSYDAAAPRLKVSKGHLAKVLVGDRESADLLRRIGDLPARRAA